MTNGQSRDSGNLGHETQKQRQTKQKDDCHTVTIVVEMVLVLSFTHIQLVRCLGVRDIDTKKSFAIYIRWDNLKDCPILYR
jgi:hypothetical protein